MLRSDSLAVLVLACAWTGCSAAPELPVTIVVSDSPEAGAPDANRTLRIEFGSGVQYRQEMESTTSGDTKKTTTVNGHPFEVVGNEIRIGPRRYGPVSVGDKVVIDTDGVRINGTLQGPLP